MDGFIHYDMTHLYPSVASIPDGTFAPNMQFVDAPDYVFENWGYDDTAIGDARFIQPTPPDGYLYDPDTGRFVPEKPQQEPEAEPEPPAEVVAALEHALNIAKGEVE